VGTRLDLAELMVRTGRPAQAEPLLKKLVEERPTDAAALEGLYRASASAKDYATAREAADALVAAQPKSPVGYYLRGMLSETEGHVATALSEYDQALALQPDGTAPLQASTRLLIANKRLPEALKRLDAFAQRSPKSPAPLAFKGEALLAEHRYTEADAALVQAIERSPEWWVPYRARSVVAVAKGDVDGAISILEAAIPKTKDPNELRAELAQIEQSHGKVDDAIHNYEEILKGSPANLAVANNLAMLLVSTHPDAPGLARAAALVAPLAGSGNPLYLDTYGWVKLKQGDAAAALAAVEKAHAAVPASAEVTYHLGMAQLAAGERAKGAGTLKQLLAGGAAFPGRDDARAALQKAGAGS
jgi:predicted Zn-dependent protease